MKRYKQQFEWDEDYTTPARMAEAPDGDWVRYEDAEALQAEAKNCTHDAAGCETRLGKAERRWAEWVTRADAAEAQLATHQAAAKAYHAELEALRARVTRAQAILATPGTWSEFAARALKELRGG